MLRYHRTMARRGDDDELDLGPDERDLDLMDGTWEQQYYSGQLRQRDWQTILLGLALLALLAMILPLVMVFLR